MVEQEVTESGKEFQIAGTADLKAREPNSELTYEISRGEILKHSDIKTSLGAILKHLRDIY